MHAVISDTKISLKVEFQTSKGIFSLRNRNEIEGFVEVVDGIACRQEENMGEMRPGKNRFSFHSSSPPSH